MYRDLAPGVENPGKRFTAEWVIGVIRDAFAASRCFGEVTVKQHAWSEVYTTDRYVNSLRTYSGHRGMDEATRNRLFTGIRAVIDQAGGSVNQPNLVVLFHARVSREYPWQESNLRHMV